MLRITAFISLLVMAIGAQANTFTFTAIPDQDETRLMSRFGKVADYLSEQLGIEVNYVPVKSYAAAISAFRNNQVQLAWFGGLSGVQARLRVPGSEAIAQGYEDQFFKSYLIAHHSTDLEEGSGLTKQLAGLSFTFGSKGSTSGRLMPEYFLRQHFQQAPKELFIRVGFSGDHSRTIALVQSGAYQLGAVNYKVWERELAEGKIDPKQVKVIWETPSYPDYQWSVRGDADQQFGQGFKQKLRKALLEMNDPELLASFPRSSFIEASNQDFAPVEQVARQLKLID